MVALLAFNASAVLCAPEKVAVLFLASSVGRNIEEIDIDYYEYGSINHV